MNGQQRDGQVAAGISDLMQRNVEAISKLEQATQSNRTPADMFADAVAGFCGTMAFVYVHAAVFAFWVLWNSPWVTPPSLHFDPPPFQALSTILSMEAIILATFIMISQNRQQRVADRRNLLDLQINMLAEQENSEMLTMLQKLMEYHGLSTPSREVEILQQATDPEVLAEQIESTLESTAEEDSGV